MADEMFRQLQKPGQYEKESSEKGILLGHPDLHRVLKELVKQEVAQPESEESLGFSKTLATVIIKNLEEVLKTRAVFIVLELIEHPETAPLILPKIKEMKKEIQKIAASLPQAKGLQILVQKLK